MLTRKDIRSGQSHERELRPVRSASNWLRDHIQTGTAHRIEGVLDDLRVPVEDLLHVSVRFLDGDLDPSARKARDGLSRDLFHECLLVAECRRSEITDEQSHSCLVDAGLHHVRMHEPVVAVGRLWREPIGGQPVNEVGGHLDGVRHPPFGVARMGVEAVKRHRHRIR